MKTRSYQQDVRAAALRDELLAADVPVLAVRPPTAPGEPTVIDLDDGADNATVDAVVAAHNVLAIDQAEAAARTQFTTDVAGLKTYLGVASPTAAQTAAATKAIIRTLRRVVGELQD